MAAASPPAHLKSRRGAIAGTGTFPARMTSEVAGLHLKAEFDGQIRLEERDAAP